jgi:hypothetical protein
MGLALTPKSIVWLLILEGGIFLLMYLSYELTKSPDVADDFGYHYSIAYSRGVLPYAALVSLNDKFFPAYIPVIIFLFIHIAVDLLLLWIATIIRKRIVAHR